MSDRPDWGDGFQRLVVASTLFSDLLTLYPTAFTPDLFGQAQSPRQRIAKAIADYWEQYRARPAAEEIDQLLREVRATITPAEGESLQAEWDYTMATEVPNDPTFLNERVKQWLEYKNLETALLKASDALSKGPAAVEEAREALEAAAPVSQGSDRLIRFVADVEQRIDMYRKGEEYGERIPTGLSAIDEALRGGPTRRETWYFLAPPKGAKTMNLNRVALGAVRRGFGVYLATFEMQAIRMALRLDRGFSNLSKEQLREDQTRLERAMQGLSIMAGGEIFIDEIPSQQPGSVELVRQRIKQLRREGYKIDVAILDYLNIMGSGRNEKEKRHELTRASREMSNMAKTDDLLVWSAALVNRQAVNKAIITKDDIAEAFEVIAVADGVITVCSPPILVRQGIRRYYMAAAREEQDQRMVGDYNVNFDTMNVSPADSRDVDAMLDAEAALRGRRRGTTQGQLEANGQSPAV